MNRLLGKAKQSEDRQTKERKEKERKRKKKRERKKKRKEGRDAWVTQSVGGLLSVWVVIPGF